MTRVPPQAAVGVVESGNAAVLVTVLPSGQLLDRRSVDLGELLAAMGRAAGLPWLASHKLAAATALSTWHSSRP